MLVPEEDRGCYASKTQRDILLKLITEPTIGQDFFLTGGTALSVFYLHHRRSDDLDLFTLPPCSLSEVALWVKRTWPQEMSTLRQSEGFFSCLIREVRVDFVVDPLSSREVRRSVTLEKGRSLQVDTIWNIASNKFCAAVSRMEPKDFVDVYFIFKNLPDISFDELFEASRKKDAIFDDPPTAAFQIEEGISSLSDNPDLFPPLLVDYKREDFFRFFEECAKRVYQKANPS